MGDETGLLPQTWERSSSLRNLLYLTPSPDTRHHVPRAPLGKFYVPKHRRVEVGMRVGVDGG